MATLLATGAHQSPDQNVSVCDKGHNATLKIGEKILVVAIQKGGAGVLITPIDIEHEGDDQTALSVEEQASRKQCEEIMNQERSAFEKYLKAMYQMFAGRLYREKFRTVENFCFALYGMHRIPAEKQSKARSRVKAMQSHTEEVGT